MSIKKTIRKTSRKADPHASREAENYEHPLPSRELILDAMAEEGAPLSVERLYELMEIRDEEREIFNRRLRAMERDGQVIRNRKDALCLAEKIHLIPGTVIGHRDGYGFCKPDAGGDDLFLGPREMEKVLHGDRIMVRQSGFDRKGRPEGKIVEVLERPTTMLVGRIIREQGLVLVAAEDKRINRDILIPPGQDKRAEAGQVVMVQLIEQPSAHSQPIGKVIEILGNYADPGMEIEIALRKHNLPHEFPKAAIKLAEKYPREVQAADYKGRVDLREMALITIDGETARDFDDAVFCEPQGKGWRLVVAIADVSFYVKPGDELDKEAYSRGNSVYFPRRVIPMLPEALSNGLCSLNPDVERLCMVCDMQIDGFGNVKRFQFYPSVMRSKARMTYTKVYEMLQAPDGELAKENAWLMPHLQNLYALYQVLLQAREKRGAIEFESSETVMLFNDAGKIEAIVPSHRNDAHKLIEECMLAANVCAAEFLALNQHPGLYRVHEGPPASKLEKVRGFMADFGFHLGGGGEPHAKDYAKLRAQIKGRPDEMLLQTVLLRSMQQAVYTPENQGHFGLAYEAYAHFTSPIRRYPDLITHRAIKAVLTKKPYKAGNWEELGAHCSMTERRADDATRDVEAWLKCFYMQDKVGEVFTGTVAGVAAFGLFVALDEVFIEGMLHVTELGNDYFNFDPLRHEMMGERTGVRFRLGDRLSIKVARVDLETSKIDFVLAESPKQFAGSNPLPAIQSNPSGSETKSRSKARKPVLDTPEKRPARTTKTVASKTATKEIKTSSTKPRKAKVPNPAVKITTKPKTGVKATPKSTAKPARRSRKS